MFCLYHELMYTIIMHVVISENSKHLSNQSIIALV